MLSSAPVALQVNYNWVPAAFVRLLSCYVSPAFPPPTQRPGLIPCVPSVSPAPGAWGVAQDGSSLSSCQVPEWQGPERPAGQGWPFWLHLVHEQSQSV